MSNPDLCKYCEQHFSVWSDGAPCCEEARLARERDDALAEVKRLNASCEAWIATVRSAQAERDTERAMRLEREGLLAAERERFAIAAAAFEEASAENASLRKLLYDAHARLSGRG